MITSAAVAELPDPPILDIDPFSEDVLADPYDFHRILRETAPVVFLKPHGLYAVGRYEELKTVQTDYARFTTTGGVGMSDIRKPGAWRTASPITEIDPPQHTAVRKSLMKVLSPVTIRQWRSTFAAEAEIAAARVVEKGEFDAVKELVEAFVLKVFPDVLGVDMPREHFVAIGEMNFNQLGPNNAILQRSMEKVESILPAYQESFQRKSMLPGGFGEKIFQAEDAGDFAAGTAPAHVRSFLRAGVDTTMAGIGHTLNFLADNPDQWERLRSDPSKARDAFEEAIRLESPSQTMFRTTVHETELSGYRLAADVKVAMFMGAANRDPRQWPDPDRFDMDRQVAGVHLAFGSGDHICIGQMIARLEAETLLQALARRVARLERTGPAAFRLVNTLRTLDRLPLRAILA